MLLLNGRSSAVGSLRASIEAAISYELYGSANLTHLTQRDN